MINDELIRFPEEIFSMGLLKMADKYSPSQLEEACKTALSYTQSPSYKSVSNILATSKGNTSESEGTNAATIKPNANGITRGADYYRRKHS